MECGATASGKADGWRAELGSPHHEDEVVILCPDCWEREFGHGRRPRLH